ncbi:hypothetical protein BT246_70890 (plasmid) [Bacillus thuringiensis]|uniref:Uncharacterized protein n=1 Tax=Bacillus thuringiensis TaxID=1428 RepID=A0A9W3X4L9_BACTU|nr:hypothetical protein [Bacillus thuringiensis]ANS52379.1 hypothetical protein BT246_70890 [Bacillus thuringiensis]
MGFDTKIEFESYAKEHPIAPNFSKVLQSSSQIYSTFFHDINLKGAPFHGNAGRNPVILTNFNAASNNEVSSIPTHKFGNYTTLYEYFQCEHLRLVPYSIYQFTEFINKNPKTILSRIQRIDMSIF